MNSCIRSLSHTLSSHTQTPTQQVDDDADVETWTRMNGSITLKHTSLRICVYMSESVGMEIHTYLSRTYPTLLVQ